MKPKITELKPPFFKIPIGEIRNFTLFDTQESVEKTIANEGLYELETIKSFFTEKNMQLIGFYNDYGPIMVFGGEENKGVFALDLEELSNRPIQIAESLDLFYTILNQVKKDWEGLENEISMKKTPENLKKREKLLELVRTICPSADLSYWDFQVYRELSIGMS